MSRLWDLVAPGKSPWPPEREEVEQQLQKIDTLTGIAATNFLADCYVSGYKVRQKALEANDELADILGEWTD